MTYPDILTTIKKKAKISGLRFYYSILTLIKQ
jgi:hypothetical protein